MFRGKKILVLGGAFQHCKVVEAAHELGMIVYVTDYLKDSPAKKIADVSLMFDVKDVDGIVNYCKKNNIDAVINTSLDPCQIPYQEICEKLKLPCYGNREQFEILTNKKLFKEYCNKYGVDTIESYDWDDLRCNRNIKYPIIIKDPCNRGSRGQYVCNNNEEVKNFLVKNKNLENIDNLVVERFMRSYDDFTVGYIIVDGTAHLVRTGDRYVGYNNENLNRVAIAAVSPSKHTQMFLDEVNSKVIKMLKSLGIKNGPVFMQGFIDGNKVRFYDPGFRFGGGEYENILKRATNVDLIKKLVVFSCIGKIPWFDLEKDIFKLENKSAFQLLPALNPGVISYIENDIIQNKNILYSQRCRIGDIISNSNNVSRRFAEIFILCKDNASKKIFLNNIHRRLIVKNDIGENLICKSFQDIIMKFLNNDFR